MDWSQNSKKFDFLFLSSMEHFIRSSSLSILESDLENLKRQGKVTEIEEMWRSTINPRLNYGTYFQPFKFHFVAFKKNLSI